MQDFLLIGGLILLVLGIRKRSETWGRISIAAGLAMLVALGVLYWPEAVESFQEGYREGLDNS